MVSCTVYSFLCIVSGSACMYHNPDGVVFMISHPVCICTTNWTLCLRVICPVCTCTTIQTFCFRISCPVCMRTTICTLCFKVSCPMCMCAAICILFSGSAILCTCVPLSRLRWSCCCCCQQKFLQSRPCQHVLEQNW